METYHALTPTAPAEQPSDKPATLVEVAPPAPEPEPPTADERPAAIVNQTLEELAREGARRCWSER